MRRSVLRGVVVLSIVVLALGAFASPRDERGLKGGGNPIVKMVKRIVKSLGDGLHVPTP